MSKKQSHTVWLKDLIQHLQECHEQLEWTHDPITAQMLTNNMLQDLDTCKRLISQMRSRIPAPAVA